MPLYAPFDLLVTSKLGWECETPGVRHDPIAKLVAFMFVQNSAVRVQTIHNVHALLLFTCLNFFTSFVTHTMRDIVCVDENMANAIRDPSAKTFLLLSLCILEHHAYSNSWLRYLIKIRLIEF
jgi:hypothetical protein